MASIFFVIILKSRNRNSQRSEKDKISSLQRQLWAQSSFGEVESSCHSTAKRRLVHHKKMLDRLTLRSLAYPIYIRDLENGIFLCGNGGFGK
jgi:hypothetical protein